MGIQFEFFDIILSLGIVQAVFLSLALRQTEGEDKAIHRVLVQILLVTAYVLMGRMIIKHHIAWEFFRWFAFTDSIIFIFGLLNYIYVRRILERSDNPYRPSWKHFIPLAICSLVFLSMNFIGPERFRALQRAGYLFWAFSAFELIGLISNAVYLTLSFMLLSKYKRAKQRMKSGLFSFLLCYLVVLGLSMVFWAISYVNLRYFSLRTPYISYDIIWVIIPFFVYTVAYFSLRKPELFKKGLKEQPAKPSLKRLTTVEVKSLKSSLEVLMKKEKVYMQNDLTLRELASLLNTSSNNVSWLLNNEYNANFYDFINQYRIAEFLNRAQGAEGREQTILSLAMEVGFNSKSTFNKVFKEQKLVTPREYIKNLSEVA